MKGNRYDLYINGKRYRSFLDEEQAIAACDAATQVARMYFITTAKPKVVVVKPEPKKKPVLPEKYTTLDSVPDRQVFGYTLEWMDGMNVACGGKPWLKGEKLTKWKPSFPVGLTEMENYCCYYRKGFVEYCKSFGVELNP